MSGFIRFVAFTIILVGLLVFVVVPVIASPLLTQMVRDAGLEADDLNVRIEAFDPSLFFGRTEKLHLEATNVVIAPAMVGRLDLTLGRVSFLDRSFETISGELKDVAVRAGGMKLNVASVQVEGPAEEARASGQLTAAQSEQLVRAAALREGVQIDGVRFARGGLVISRRGIEVPAAVAVRGGALVLQASVGPPVLLLQPAPSDPWRLTESYATSGGITISGVIDATRLTDQVPGAP